MCTLLTVLLIVDLVWGLVHPLLAWRCLKRKEVGAVLALVGSKTLFLNIAVSFN